MFRSGLANTAHDAYSAGHTTVFTVAAAVAAAGAITAFALVRKRHLLAEVPPSGDPA